MYNVGFDFSWSFNELVKNIEAIKFQIWDIIASFSYFERHEETLFKRYVKDCIYSYPFSEKRKNLIIEYIYDDVEIERLLELVKENKNGKRNHK